VSGSVSPMTGAPPTHPAAYRVVLVHSFYASDRPSGENAAVLDQAEALRARGHEVRLVAAYTDTLKNEPAYAIRAAARVGTGWGRSPLPELEEFAPDVVHVHNLFPNFGTSWLKRWHGPVVATVHNFRPVCCGATLFRDGKTCTVCPDGDRWAGLRNGCYRGTRMASLPLAWAGRGGVRAHPLLSRADRLVILSQRSRALYVGFGLPEHNFSASDSADSPSPAGSSRGTVHRWLFAGRLSEEKGILPMLRSWPSGHLLDVIGAGPLEEDCRSIDRTGVRLLGALSRDRLLAELPIYAGLIFPSICPEGSPLIVQEALAAGVPVLALSGSSAADSVRLEGTGAVYDSNAELPRALTAAEQRFPALKDHCRQVYAERYSRRAWADKMTAVYAQVTEAAP